MTEGEEVLNRYDYDAWGNVTESQEKVENRFKFNGQQFDSISQQYYLRARYYNPVIGRFTQEDTYRGDGLNLYAYCANNPVYYVDPSGNECKSAKDRVETGTETAKNTVKEPSKLAEHQKNNGTDGKSNAPKGYYKDVNGRWHRPNGQFASNTEVGLPAPRSRGSNKRSDSSNTKGGSGTTNGGSNLTGVTYEGTIYRSVNSAYNPLEMNDYTIQSNHRYTKKGTPGLYFSSGEKIVKAELGNYDVTDFSNRTMYSYDVKLDNMLDVSNPNIRNQLGMSLDSIIGDSYDVTHSIGEFAYSSGYNGIIAPSARADGGVNVIVFDPKIIN